MVIKVYLDMLLGMPRFWISLTLVTFHQIMMIRGHPSQKEKLISGQYWNKKGKDVIEILTEKEAVKKAFLLEGQGRTGHAQGSHLQGQGQVGIMKGQEADQVVGHDRHQGQAEVNIPLLE